MPNDEIKISWGNDSQTANYCLSRRWEPLHADSHEGSPAKTDYTVESLELIHECLWGRSKSHMVLTEELEALLVLGFLGDFNTSENHPSYGAMWASKTTYDYVERRIKTIINEALPALE
jgi:hypothetical protein